MVYRCTYQPPKAVHVVTSFLKSTVIAVLTLNVNGLVVLYALVRVYTKERQRSQEISENTRKFPCAMRNLHPRYGLSPCGVV